MMLSCETEEKEEREVLLRFAEKSLAQDWDRPEEEEAWAHLNPGKGGHHVAIR